ncbi:MAG: formate--tetrahydrofolate ligase [Acholeplasmatales bacterium]|jgi:formate--tetrahydrofolate ligase|nr:formate--tetrahydrofolate ligase [Acholeplasmatales bacterium]
MDKLKSTIKKLGIESKYVTFYPNEKAKINIKCLESDKNKQGKLILVTAMTPTAKGEGKTTISIGLCDGLNLLKQGAILALREPSLGPVFGLKGGAVGGGKTTLLPGAEINLHFNGDFHAITSAHNLLSAAIDNHLHFGNNLKIKEVYWPRAIDMNDRALRDIETIYGKRKFIITAASEIMAILALSISIDDLRSRLGDIIIGIDFDDNYVYAKKLNCVEGLMVLLKEAINPNIVQSYYGSPALIHTGPFANVAHGCSSVFGTLIGLKYANFVVTEAGFGSDLGAEKFMDIKVPIIKKNPDCVVIVATIQAIKYHGEYNNKENILENGLKNLAAHINNIKQFNLPFVVAINVFDTDKKEDLEVVSKWCEVRGYPCCESRGFKQGAKGCLDLARMVMDNCVHKDEIKGIYDIHDLPSQKILQIAQKVYGATNVEFSKRAALVLDKIGNLDYQVCIAKTPLSLSGDATLLNVPEDFNLSISNIIVNNGSKLLVCLTKGIVTLPGLGVHPRYEDMKLDKKGNIIL